jgi:mono/diheme cytochrome c family protein
MVPPRPIVLTPLGGLYTIAAQVHTSILQRILGGGAVVVLIASVYVRAQNAADAHREVVNRYCVSCHNDKTRTGGLSLENLNIASVGDRSEIWEKVVQKLHGNLMPPAGRPRPDEAAYKSLITYLETSLDRAAETRPDPGRTQALHRLNRAEYRNAVRDLLALDLDVSAMLPADDVSYGFDNIAGVQRMSPTLMERYLAAAQKISSVAVGASARAATTDTFIVPPELRQDDRIDGLPFGTRGGTALNYTFPRDGVYSVRVQLTRYAGASFDEIPAFDQAQRLELSVDGTPVHVFQLLPAENREGRGYGGPNRRALDADWQARFPAKAGPRTVALTFLNRTPALLENLLEPSHKPLPGGPNGYYTTQKGAYLRSIEISGPYEAGGAGDTPSRARIFVCRPKPRDASEAARGDGAPQAKRESGGQGPPDFKEDSCAKTVLQTLARRAFRRPVADSDLQTLLSIYKDGRAEGSFELGIERAVEGLLVSPEFLYRIEREPASSIVDQSTTYRISDLELASRLSFFLWSSIPDDQLLEGATSGKLRNGGVLEQQVRRMLADSRADALVTNFVGQWLFLRNLPTVLPDPKRDQDFDEDLRQGFRRETELLAASVLREDRSVLDLLSANYTFVNERLAKHYGIPNIRGTHFRRVEIADDNRRGLLGHGSVLVVTSFPHRTSPVVRGKWILENLLGTIPPSPPPDVPVLKEKPNPSEETQSMRQRIAQHRANPACASCHAMMDPLGLSLENFDLVGKWRTADEALLPIDASGTLPDGTKFEGPAGLRHVLLNPPDRFVRTLTEKMLTYALGRGLEHYDMPAVRKITRDAARNNYRASSIILGVVNSLPFQMRRRQS